MKYHQVVIKVNDNELNIINNIMNKYNFNKSQAIRYIINNHENSESNNNRYYKNLISGFVMKMDDALNQVSMTGNTKYAYDAMEEFKCQILS